MKKTEIICIICLGFALAFGPAGAAFAASQVTLAPTSGTSFVVQGAAMGEAAAIDITLSYDTVAWSSPRVSQGALTAGALTAVNTNSPGTVRIGIISTKPLPESGIIATVSFTARGNAAGPPFGLDVKLTRLDGTPLPVNVRVINPPNPGTGGPDQPALVEESPGPTPDPALPAAPVATSPAEASPSPRGRTGMVMLPNSGGAAATGADSGLSGQSSPKYGFSGETGSAAPKAAKSTDRSENTSQVSAGREIEDLTSILERFKEYSGDRRPQDFIALFEFEGASRFRQNPAIALADGETLVEVILFSESGHDHSMDLAVMGADLVSIEEDPGDSRSLVLKLLPGKGVYEASLALPLDNLMVVLPLVVAPRLNVDLDNSGTVTDSDFTLFLEKGSAFDLNGDGKRDYLDDYLFTANYLAAKQGKETVGPESKPGNLAGNPRG
jgi:hypothetical protein